MPGRENLTPAQVAHIIVETWRKQLGNEAGGWAYWLNVTPQQVEAGLDFMEAALYRREQFQELAADIRELYGRIGKLEQQTHEHKQDE